MHPGDDPNAGYAEPRRCRGGASRSNPSAKTPQPKDHGKCSFGSSTAACATATCTFVKATSSFGGGKRFAHMSERGMPPVTLGTSLTARLSPRGLRAADVAIGAIVSSIHGLAVVGACAAGKDWTTTAWRRAGSAFSVPALTPIICWCRMRNIWWTRAGSIPYGPRRCLAQETFYLFGRVEAEVRFRATSGSP